MCLAGLHYCFFREEQPSSSQEPAQAQNAAESREAAAPSPGARQVEQLSPSEPRVQSDYNVWASMRLFSRRVAQNLMALIHTGRLRSTVIENFKTSLKNESFVVGGLAWRCEIYESCCTLLDIGCKPGVVMRELQETLPPNEYITLDKNFKTYQEALNKEGSKTAVAKELLRWAFIRYSSSCLDGEILSSHSMLKRIEKLLAHIQNDGIDIVDVSKSAWREATRKIGMKIFNSSNESGVSDDRMKKYKLSQEARVENVANALMSLIKIVKSRKTGEIKNKK